MVSAKLAVAMAVPVENPADCKARGVTRFLQADEILGMHIRCPADTSLAA